MQGLNTRSISRQKINFKKQSEQQSISEQRDAPDAQQLKLDLSTNAQVFNASQEEDGQLENTQANLINVASQEIEEGNQSVISLQDFGKEWLVKQVLAEQVGTAGEVTRENQDVLDEQAGSLEKLNSENYDVNYCKGIGKESLQDLTATLAKLLIGASHGIQTDPEIPQQKMVRKEFKEQVSEKVYQKTFGRKDEQENESVIAVEIEVQNTKIEVTLEGLPNGSLQISLATDVCVTTKTIQMTLDQMITTLNAEFESDKNENLHNLFISAWGSHTLTLEPILKNSDVTLGTPQKVIWKIDPQNTPGDYPFVSVNAGTTCYSLFSDLDIADTATTLMHEGMFASTAVRAYELSENAPFNSKSYSALITAAALHTVKYGVKLLGLTGEALQRYFFQTIQTLDIDKNFKDGAKRGVTFAGTVFFINDLGHKEMFAHGFGDTAAVMNTTDGAHLLHMQGDCNMNIDNENVNNIFVLRPDCSTLMAEHFTTTLHRVDVETTSCLQIMSGCELVFFDPPTATGLDKKLSFSCNEKLPKDGKIHSYAFAKSINVNELNRVVHKQEDVFQSRRKLEEKIDGLLAAMNIKNHADNRDKYRELATPKGQNKYANPKCKLPSIEEVQKVIDADDALTIQEAQLLRQAKLTKGSSVVHLAIDVREAFAALKSEKESNLMPAKNSSYI